MNKTSTRIPLNDNRWIGYAEFGDPLGSPCLFVHGYGSSRWMAGWAFADELLRHHAIRIVAIDRPSYGLSSSQSTAGFGHWANDAAALAAHLDIKQMAVVGVSMGAGPALALTALRPDLVSNTTILSGMPPLDSLARWAPASRADAFYWRLARHAPWLLERMCALSASILSKAATGNADSLIERTERALPQPDRAVFRTLLDNDASRAAFIADIRESTRQGGSATAGDLRQYLRPWGVELSAIDTPVQLWHGHEDTKVPIEAVQRLADALPRCTTRYLPGGHFSPFTRPNEILKDVSFGDRR